MTEPVKADQIEFAPVDWLWRHRIPKGMISIIGGKPDQGKGLLCCAIAADVSNTQMRSGKKLRYGNVIYSAIEDSYRHMTGPRLAAAGARLGNIDLDRFLLPLDLQELAERVIAEQVDLLVIDPLAAHLSRGVSRFSDSIRTVLTPLKDLAEQTGLAVVIVEHVLKRVPANADPLSAIGGNSSGVVAASRMAYLFGSDPKDDDRRVMAPVKSNISEKPQTLAFEIDVQDIEPIGDIPYLMFDSEIEFDVQSLITRPGKGVGRPPDKRSAAAEWLSNYLFKAHIAGMPAIGSKWPVVQVGEGVPSGRIFEDAKHFGMTAKTLRRAATDQEIIKDPPGGGRGCKWVLPDHIIDALSGASDVITPTEMPTVEVDPLEVNLAGMDAELAKLLSKQKEMGDGQQ